MFTDTWRRTFYFNKKPDSPFYEEGIKWGMSYAPIHWWSDNYVCQTIVNEETLPVIFVEVYKDIKEWFEELKPQNISSSVHKYRLFQSRDTISYNFYDLTLREVENKIDEIYNYINNIDGFYYMSNMLVDFNLWISVTEVKKLEGDTFKHALKELLIQNFASSVYPRDKVEALIKHIDFYSL